MTYATVCSGINAPGVAWHTLGWRAAFHAEIEPFPCAVLAHHEPQTPNLGNMEAITREQIEGYRPVSVFCAGTPCQSFSVAGLRGGMADPRGNLALVFLRLVDWIRPAWVVYENVPGLLSSNGGRDFGSIIGGLGELGYGWAYRILDAQHFGIPQRRRRVFVVGHLGDWRPATAVLFERHCLSGNPPPSREAGARVAASLTGSLGRRCGVPDNAETEGQLIGINNFGVQDVATCLSAKNQRLDGDTETFVTHALRAEGFDASEDGTGRGTLLVPVAFAERGTNVSVDGDTTATMKAAGDNTGGRLCVAYGAKRPNAVAAIRRNQTSANGHGITDGVAHTIDSTNGQAIAFEQNQRDEVRLVGGDGQRATAVKAENGIKNQCYIAQPVAFSTKESGKDAVEGLTPPLRAESGDPHMGGRMAVAFQERGREGGRSVESQPDIAYSLNAPNGGGRRQEMNVASGMAVRRLLPVECEKLQGFSPGYTAIPFRNKPAADGPRYRALGNSMAVPVLLWIGQRIEAVEAALRGKAGAA